MCLTPKAPKIPAAVAPAPAPMAPEVQRQLAPRIDTDSSSGQKRSRTGRNSLRIDLASAAPVGGLSGLNIPS